MSSSTSSAEHCDCHYAQLLLSEAEYDTEAPEALVLYAIDLCSRMEAECAARGHKIFTFEDE